MKSLRVWSIGMIMEICNFLRVYPILIASVMMHKLNIYTSLTHAPNIHGATRPYIFAHLE